MLIYASLRKSTLIPLVFFTFFIKFFVENQEQIYYQAVTLDRLLMYI